VIPYISAYLFYLLVIAIGLTQRKLYPWVLAASIPMILLVFMRGMVGVDTPFYEQTIDLIRIAGTYTFTFEPLFEYAVLGLANIMDSSFAVIGAVAAVTTFLLFIANQHSKIRIQVLALGIIPYFYLDMTMNGVRYGLAFAFVLFSTSHLARGRKKTFAILALIAGMIQITALLLAGLLYLLLDIRWKRIIALGLATIALFTVGGDYLLLKIEDNRGLATETITAGIAPLVLSLIMIGGCLSEPVLKTKFKAQLVLLLLLTVATYTLTQFVYVGLRFQQLNLFLIFGFIITALEMTAKKLNPRALICSLIAVCLLGSALRLKNFHNDAGQGDAPFAPYLFYWEGSR
jgi:hypothetical protein